MNKVEEGNERREGEKIFFRQTQEFCQNSASDTAKHGSSAVSATRTPYSFARGKRFDRAMIAIPLRRAV
jgi:hypothetical protein